MRIGMLSMDYPPRMAGGTTVHTYQMARHFAGLGHAPTVVAASHPDAPAREDGAVRVRRVKRPYSFFSALEGGKLMGELDAVHGHGTCAYGFMRLYEFPTVIKMHNTWLGELERYRAKGRPTGLMGMYVHMDRYCARNAGAVIAISGEMKRETMRYGVEEDRITVIHNGIDAGPFGRARGRKEEMGWEDRVVIGYVGRLADHKGVVPLALAFGKLARRYDDARLLVVGDGPARPEMEAVLSGIKDRVRFTGFVPHEEVPDYYASSDIMVYPTDYEPLGNVVLESMAAGRPLVASRTGGIPEIFDEGCGTMIAPPKGDGVGELTGALDELISSGSMRKKMGERGREVVNRYTWKRVCERTVEVMEGLLRA